MPLLLSIDYLQKNAYEDSQRLRVSAQGASEDRGFVGEGVERSAG
jgi:hypothetical protein